MKHTVRQIVDNLRFSGKTKEPKVSFIDELLEEFKARVTYAHWPHSSMGYVFGDGKALLLGHLKPVEAYPKLFLRTKVKAKLKETSNLRWILILHF